ncbi:hypothetical protein SDC9_127475 [bioreactor metagenome]|uniref:Uncharacterized protein n=1 Tax=bioreactor metagenome TaxID=1076179 RepID=A0A645CU80_9ZZZZ
MGGQHEIAQGFVTVGLRRLADGEEITQGFGHFAVIDADKAVMQPVVDEFAAVGGLRLGDLVFVMGELKVLPAAVDIDGLAQIAAGHGRALYMPAGPAFSPGGFPEWFTGFGGLPQGEVHGVFLSVVHINSGAGLQIVQGLVGELSVLLEFPGPVVDVAVYLVGISLIHQSFHHVDDLVHIFGCLGMDGGIPHSKAVGVRIILFYIFFCDLTGGDVFLIGAADDFIVHIGKILSEGDSIAPVFQITAQHIENDNRSGVSHMDKIIDGGPAGIHGDFSRTDRNKVLFLS